MGLTLPIIALYNGRMTLNYISLLGLTLSILLLLISCSIFTFSPSLRSGRVTMHNNLILSLLGSSLAWLAWHFSVLDRHHIWAANSLWCRSAQGVSLSLSLSLFYIKYRKKRHLSFKAI